MSQLFGANQQLAADYARLLRQPQPASEQKRLRVRLECVHAMSRQTIHITFQVFKEKPCFRESTAQHSSKQQGAIKRKRISMYFTPTRLSSGSCAPTHPASPSAIHSGFITLQFGGLRSSGGERGENAEYKSEAEGRGRDWETRADGRIRVCHGSPRIFLKADFFFFFEKPRLRRRGNLRYGAGSRRCRRTVSCSSACELAEHKPGCSQSRPTEAGLRSPASSTSVGTCL